MHEGCDCFADQILYNIGTRGAEYDLLPWLAAHDVLPMSYSSLGSSYTNLRRECERDRIIQKICAETGLSVSALMLAFNSRSHGLSSLFSSSSSEHIQNNLKGLDFDITPFMGQIDEEFPAPTHKVALEKL